MSDVVYRIVEHDGGWAYKLGDVFSETFATRGDAEAAASRVAAEQRVPGAAEAIEWQDEDGDWHEEYESGGDRPDAMVEDLSLTARDAPAPAHPLLAVLLIAGAVGMLLATAFHGRRNA
jgi:Uncharacterized protein conserved in bacteria (DUF2188)